MNQNQIKIYKEDSNTKFSNIAEESTTTHVDIVEKGITEEDCGLQQEDNYKSWTD
jgi:hypothetical protein